MTTVTVEAPVRPSEDEAKVRTAMLNIFPELDVRLEDGRLVGTTASLSKFGQLLKRDHIRDAARGVLVRGMKGECITVFRLNKQAAFMGKVGFADLESPLGELRVRIESDNLLNLLDSLAPDTRPLSVRLAAEARLEGKKPRKVTATNDRPEFASKQDMLKLVEEFKEEQ